MKAISLHQPWASLVALGKKQYETRHWRTAYRGPIAIHAALRWTREQLHVIVATPRIGAALEPLGPGEWRDVLPFGCIVAIAELTGCLPVELVAPDADEAAFGDWRPGRYCWRLENVRRLIAPVPCRGAQGFFEINAPEEEALNAGGDRAYG